jgi:hypothetical protein
MQGTVEAWAGWNLKPGEYNCAGKREEQREEREEER